MVEDDDLLLSDSLLQAHMVVVKVRLADEGAVSAAHRELARLWRSGVCLPGMLPGHNSSSYDVHVRWVSEESKGVDEYRHLLCLLFAAVLPNIPPCLAKTEPTDAERCTRHKGSLNALVSSRYHPTHLFPVSIPPFAPSPPAWCVCLVWDRVGWRWIEVDRG